MNSNTEQTSRRPILPPAFAGFFGAIALGGIFIGVMSAKDAEAANTFTIPNPTIPATTTGTVPLRLDFCARWGRECGLPAADQFCRSFRSADGVDFTVDPDIGARTPTRTIRDGLTCDQGFCDGFSSITCQEKRQVDSFKEACSSTALFPNQDIRSAREFILGSLAPRRADGVTVVRNGGLALTRNDPNRYEIDLRPNQRSVNFFCLNDGTWHKEVYRCDKTSDIVHISRQDGGRSRKIRIRCYQ